MGYFKKKTGSVGSSTNTDFRPNANYVGPTANLDPTPGVHPTGGYVGNCNAPLEIVNVHLASTLLTVGLSSHYYRCKSGPGVWTLTLANDNYEKSANIDAPDGVTTLYFNVDQLPPAGRKYTGILTLTNGDGVVSKPFKFPLIT